MGIFGGKDKDDKERKTEDFAHEIDSVTGDSRVYDTIEIEGLSHGGMENGPNPYRKRIMLTLLFLLAIWVLLCVLPLPFGQVKIEGNSQITVDNLVNLGLIKKPINILQIHRARLEDELSKDLRIESVRTMYKLPLTLDIRIEKKVPRAVVMTDFGYGYVDKNGQCIDLSSSVSGNNVPIISGVKLGNVLLGDYVYNKNVLAGVEYLSTLTDEERNLISEVNVGNKAQIVAYTKDGTRMNLGSGEKMSEKAKLSMQMLKDVKRKKLAILYMDVNLDSPFIKVQQ